MANIVLVYYHRIIFQLRTGLPFKSFSYGRAEEVDRRIFMYSLHNREVSVPVSSPVGDFLLPRVYTYDDLGTSYSSNSSQKALKTLDSHLFKAISLPR